MKHRIKQWWLELPWPTKMTYACGLLMMLTAGVVWAMGHPEKSDGLVISGVFQWVAGLSFHVGHRDGFMAGFYARDAREREDQFMREMEDQFIRTMEEE